MSAATPQSRRRRGVLARLAAIDDGTILKVAFYAMLAGTVAVLTIDYLDLSDNAPLPNSTTTANPALPAVERPDVDPDDPAFHPHETITTPQDVLTAPLSIELGPDGMLELIGTIGPGASERFAAELERRGGYVETIALDSPGGAVDEALAIAGAIREGGYATRVMNGAVCASSCPLVLAAGTERIIDPQASVGVHQIYATSATAAEVGAAQAMSDAQTLTARITRHLEEMGVDPALWVHAMETPPNRLYYFTREELADYALASSVPG